MGEAEGPNRESGTMRARPPTVLLLMALPVPLALPGCTSQTGGSSGDCHDAQAAPPFTKGEEEELGPNEPMEDWPRPLANHDGWTRGLWHTA